MSDGAFVLDPFQIQALAAVDAGVNVLVAAPTGAGKTVVAEHAVGRALAAGRRAFYTTPIKALSNQKFADLVARHGRDQVGLLTGDNAVRPDAPVVVMTTEVLRNMIYAGAQDLNALAWVVLDEVHYLQDPYRGPVWEEVIVHAPEAVRFVCLSATVSNAEELAGWIRSARGPTEVVIETERPVELVNHYLVHDRATDQLVQVETLVDGRVNPEGSRFDQGAMAVRHGDRGRGGRPRQRWGTPRRPEVVEHLAGSRLLPAICFVFSRKGCDDAARSVVDAGARLTTAAERARIRSLVDQHVGHLSDADLALLGYDRWLGGLEAGVAAHHAGMVPPFKEAVEACFVEGLVKVVFATETLALGINMPARSVVIESLSKFTGDQHEDLTPSQYTQLTGRAGRRGLDPVGHALVLWSPWSSFDKVAALASSREFVLRSAFAPTYNMVANLVGRYPRERALEMLGRSFAQYQADRLLGRLESRRASRRRALADAEEAARCELGDVDEYREVRAAARRAAREARALAQQERTDALAELRPGDVVELGGHRHVVLSVSHRRHGLQLRLVDVDARLVTIEEAELRTDPVHVGHLDLPEGYDPRSRPYQRQVANALRRLPTARSGRRSTGQGRPGGAGATGASSAAPTISPHDLPVASCPDLDAHLAAAADRDRLRRQVAELDARISGKETSLTDRFGRVERLLTRWGFLDGWALTPRGRILASVFHESDLLIAAAIADGLLDGLDPAELAGVASVFTYEHRSKEPPAPPRYPSPTVADRVRSIEALARDLQAAEADARLPRTATPDPTFLAQARAWAAGERLGVVLDPADLSGGDFVRNIKQLIDLLGQVATVAPLASTRRTARAAAEQMHRDLVAVSSEVTEPPGPAPVEADAALDAAGASAGQPVGEVAP